MKNATKRLWWDKMTRRFGAEGGFHRSESFGLIGEGQFFL